MPQLLLVDDEINFLTATADLLTEYGYDVTTADSLDTARTQLRNSRFDALLVDLMLPDGNGLELLELDESQRPDHVILMTGQPGIKSLVRDLHGPGLDYLIKPIDISDLLEKLKPASPGQEQSPAETSAILLGESEAMQRVKQQIAQVAAMDTTVLINGESGTGKELVAEAIHVESGRNGELVPVNCGAFSSELLGSQLFGHEKGAFTGATKRHLGVFERSAEGTLFLDEITEMPIDQQPHLLRALETNKITRVGAEGEIPVSCRVVAASNRSLAEAIEAGRLREDLYFRLSIYPIELPPLRARHGDVPILARAFLQDLNTKYETQKTLPDSSLENLQAWHWPGNVRELKHVIHRHYIDCTEPAGDLVIPKKFSIDITANDNGAIKPGRSIDDVERELIMATLEHCDGDKPSAAKMLGISLKTLYNRLSSYDSEATDE